MRLFHFVSSEHGLAAIRDQRYKISTYDNLNDPFELFAADFSDPEIRTHFRASKNRIAQLVGLLCCSKSWNSTLLWSHYADKHRGLALELEVEDSCISHITYSSARATISPEDMDEFVSTPIGKSKITDLMTIKADCWSYENEARVLYNLSIMKPDERGLYFSRFNERVALKGVVLGPLCNTKASDIQAIIPKGSTLSVKKARIAFRSFKVTDDLSFGHKQLVGAA